MTDYIMMFTLPGRLQFYRSLKQPLKPNQPPQPYFVRKLNRMLLTQEVFIVPSKRQKTGKAGNGFSTVFVNYKLAGDEKEAFRDYMEKGVEQHSKDIVRLMGAGMKFSFSENRDNGSYIASATMREEANINYDRCMTSRSNDWYECLIMCVYKCDTLGLDEDWVDQAGSDDWG